MKSPIDITLLDKKFLVNATPDNHQALKDAASHINSLLAKQSSQSANNSMFNNVLMLAFNMCYELRQLQAKNESDPVVITEKIIKINDSLKQSMAD